MDNTFRWPAAFLAALAAVIAIEAAVWRHVPARPAELEQFRFYRAHYVPAVEQSVVQWKIHGLMHRDYGEVPLLFLGDSSCLTGVDPSVILKKTGLKALNLGTVGWLSIDGHREILELYLQRQKKPRVVVYYTSAYPFVTGLDEMERIGFLWQFREWIGSREGNNASGWPSYRLRYYVADYISKLAGGAAARLRERRGGYLSDEEVRVALEEHGGFLAEPSHKPLGPADPTAFTTARLKNDPLKALRRLAEVVRGEGGRLVIVMNPMPESYRNPATEDFMDQVRAQLGSLGDTATVMDPLLRYYPDDSFATVKHLLPRGAERNSSEVASFVRSLRLAAPAR